MLSLRLRFLITNRSSASEKDNETAYLRKQTLFLGTATTLYSESYEYSHKYQSAESAQSYIDVVSMRKVACECEKDIQFLKFFISL